MTVRMGSYKKGRESWLHVSEKRTSPALPHRKKKRCTNRGKSVSQKGDPSRITYHKKEASSLWNPHQSSGLFFAQGESLLLGNGRIWERDHEEGPVPSTKRGRKTHRPCLLERLPLHSDKKSEGWTVGDPAKESMLRGGKGGPKGRDLQRSEGGS